MSNVGVYEIMYSLMVALETEVLELTEAQMIYDGATISGIPKPFATIEYLATNKQLLSAGRRNYEYGYRFQVGLYAQTFPERLNLEERLSDVLSAEEGIPLFNDSFLPTGKFVYCEVSAFTPIANDDLSNTTNNHHGYFDVAVFIMRKNGASEFTQ